MLATLTVLSGATELRLLVDLHRATFEIPYLDPAWVSAAPDLEQGELDELVRMAIDDRREVAAISSRRAAAAVDAARLLGPYISPAAGDKSGSRASCAP